MKNPQFLPNQADILPSEFIHWTDILSKFHKNWTKIVDFLVIAFDFQGWTFFWIWSQCAVHIVTVISLGLENCDIVKKSVVVLHI